jgi:hypothetical protein
MVPLTAQRRPFHHSTLDWVRFVATAHTSDAETDEADTTCSPVLPGNAVLFQVAPDSRQAVGAALPAAGPSNAQAAVLLAAVTAVNSGAWLPCTILTIFQDAAAAGRLAAPADSVASAQLATASPAAVAAAAARRPLTARRPVTARHRAAPGPLSIGPAPVIFRRAIVPSRPVTAGAGWRPRHIVTGMPGCG